MPRRSRVTPYGELVAVPDRGMFWGNRGVLVDRHGQLARYSRGQAWIICLLEYKGRRRQQWTPGRLTELFFLDEATGLAAGHRPCGECRYRDYQRFKQAWADAAHAADAVDGTDWTVAAGGTDGTVAAGGALRVQVIDAQLHADRLAGPGVRRTYQAPLAGLPDGTMIEADGRPWLVYRGKLLAWTPGGYLDRHAMVPTGPVTVITPRATVATLAAGYRPVVHPTASELA